MNAKPRHASYHLESQVDLQIAGDSIKGVNVEAARLMSNYPRVSLRKLGTTDSGEPNLGSPTVCLTQFLRCRLRGSVLSNEESWTQLAHLTLKMSAYPLIQTCSGLAALGSACFRRRGRSGFADYLLRDSLSNCPF